MNLNSYQSVRLGFLDIAHGGSCNATKEATQKKSVILLIWRHVNFL